MICTDENSLGAGLVHYRSNDHHLECPDGQNQRSTCEAEVK